MDLIVVTTFLAIHAVISSFFLFDLASVSQRQNKVRWALLLILVPLISALLYTRTRKRDRPHNG